MGGVSELETRYEQARTTPSDISEHIEILRDYARRCDSVLELGVRSCVSSWAFVEGLRDNGRDAKRLVCNDLEYHENFDTVKAVAAGVGVRVEHIVKNDLLIDVSQESFDMTFIDTWHVYGQLKRELAKFAPVTRKFIAMHDTEVDRVHGESVRCGWDTAQQSLDSGFPEPEIREGLQRAVSEFLAASPEWTLDLVRTNNNGLTVLARRPRCDQVWRGTTVATYADFSKRSPQQWRDLPA